MPGTKAILFVLTSHGELGDTGRPTGFWLSEAAYPWRIFIDAGYRVDLVSIRGGRPPVDGADTTDPVQQDFLDNAGLDHTRRLDEVDPSGYDAVLYVGGHGTMWDFPGNPAIATLGSAVYSAGGVIAAVCHGPVALLDLTAPDGQPLIQDRNVTSFTDAEERESGTFDAIPYSLENAMKQRGAKHTNAAIYAEHVVVDGRLVTGQNPSSAPGVAQAVVRILSTVD